MADDRRIPDLVSVTEAAELLGVTRQAVLLMAGNGQLPGRKVGATWVFRRTVIDALVENRTGQPNGRGRSSLPIDTLGP